MAQLTQTFDSSQHDDMADAFKPIPVGDYPAKVVESDLKTTAAKTGKYIALKFEIIKGEYKGRFIWTNLNIINPSAVAVEIAQKELATLCRAVGKGVIQDTNALHGIPFILKLKIKPAKGDYPAGNSPAGYLPIGEKTSGFPDEQAKEEQTETGNMAEPSEDGELPWPEE